MPRFAANLTMLFTEYPMPERIDALPGPVFGASRFFFPTGRISMRWTLR
ncbi:MAG: hypothetical protein R2839_06695 [Thermomicrobiales bacterium]